HECGYYLDKVKVHLINFCKGSKLRSKEQALPTVALAKVGSSGRRAQGAGRRAWSRERRGEEENGRKGEEENGRKGEEENGRKGEDCMTARQKKGHCSSDPFSIAKQADITA
ncbi:MAG: hypothetical protein L0Y37_01285, partial [Bacteroidales bacterium]|nr:hypothetical protein [Bacteroidales bacterium]